MSDQGFLTNYIEFLSFAKKKHGHQALLDVDFKFIFVSSVVVSSISNTTEKHLIGLNFVEDIPRPAHIIEKKREIFNAVLKYKEPRVYIAVSSHFSFMFRKLIICASAVINPHTGNVVGIELTGGPTNQNLIQSDKEKMLFNNNESLSFLTNYELEIIYFKCKDRTDKEVAEILSNYYQSDITAKMINHTMDESIYYKLQLHSLKELKKKTIELGIDKIDIYDLLPKDDIIVLKTGS